MRPARRSLAWPVLPAVLALASGCSLIIDSQQFVGDASPCANCNGRCEDLGLETEACCDADGDGFSPADAATVCGTVVEADCNDQNVRVFPGAPAVCGDDVINDCSGQAVPTSLMDENVAEFDRVEPFSLAALTRFQGVVTLDALAVPIDLDEGGTAHGTLVAFVRDGGDLDLVLHSESFGINLTTPALPLEVNGLPDEGVIGVSLRADDLGILIALRVFDGFTDTETVQTFGVTDLDNIVLAPDPMIEGTATAISSVTVVGDGTTIVEAGQTEDNSGTGSGVLGPAAIYPQVHGACRLGLNDREDCDSDSDVFAAPMYLRASGVFSAEEHTSTRNGSDPQLVLNDGSNFMPFPLRSNALEMLSLTGDWDILTRASGNAVVIAPVLNRGTTVVPFLKFIEFPCTAAEVSSCGIAAATRENLIAFGQSRMARLAELGSGFAVFTVADTTSGSPPIVARQVSPRPTGGYQAVTGDVPFTPQTSVAYDGVQELEVSGSGNSDGTTISLGFATFRSSDVEYWTGGMQVCFAR